MVNFAKEAIKKHETAFQAIVDVKGIRTFANTIRALNLAEYEFDSSTTPLTFLASVSPKRELRHAIGDADNLI